ncbi:hypothetical protein SNOG_07988 [Parastagonospora nodorum SN15]|uniref:Uncharacterized protein n=1 Tax=Phaeosphaeria nodorum (strain SN15 / ATCC MYA-4574 / FGSC 10173) TaxID=321614 RepID=Q0UJS6_PHANO|nr:hypothetical protein SNOG_07988 [Parastagonospora nodorum SN15]EAT84264.1 hypothetical protein SNOG_07988 [Parastagonospora nodorum SN15]
MPWASNVSMDWSRCNTHGACQSRPRRESAAQGLGGEAGDVLPIASKSAVRMVSIHYILLSLYDDYTSNDNFRDYTSVYRSDAEPTSSPVNVDS